MAKTQRYFLLGPTASGKTSVSLAMAQSLNAEIVSLDSMLVYRGMDIGTAKPSREERSPVPHHLIDVVDPCAEFSVKHYLDATAVVEQDLYARGKAALYVGGTTMWFKALMFGLLEVPQASQEIRDDIEAALACGDVEALRAELLAVDPIAWERIHRNDTRRLQRALETYRQTGKALSTWQSQWQAKNELTAPVAFLEWPREVLRARVQKRFGLMLDAGFLQEVRDIHEGCGFGRTAGKAIGYCQILEYLDGKCSLEQALQKGITKTHVLIRRQMTWLRSFPGMVKVPMQENADALEVGRSLAHTFSA